MSDNIVIFDVNEFKEIFPEFENVPDLRLENYFNLITVIIDNTEYSIIRDLKQRKIILYWAVAHVAALFNRGAEAVGVLSSASEGSVSASFAVPSSAGDEGYWNQTQYGMYVWKALLPYTLGAELHDGHKC